MTTTTMILLMDLSTATLYPHANESLVAMPPQ